MKEKLRVYVGADVDMLTTSSAITGHAIEHKDFLIAKRPAWADPFLSDHQTRINNAFVNFLGVDKAQALRDATAMVLSIQKAALNDLSDFKVQVMEDFKKIKGRRDEIFTRLGFSTDWSAAQSGSQQSLIELLLTFATNMTVELQKEISQAGTSDALINRIKEYGTRLQTSNVTQEMLKKSRQSLSAASIKEFNEIYETTISIAKISSKFFRDDKVTRGKFSFKQNMKALNGKVAKKENPAASTTTPPAGNTSAS